MRGLEFLPLEIFMVFRCAEELFLTALFSLLAPTASASTSLLTTKASVARKYFLLFQPSRLRWRMLLYRRSQQQTSLRVLLEETSLFSSSSRRSRVFYCTRWCFQRHRQLWSSRYLNCTSVVNVQVHAGVVCVSRVMPVSMVDTFHTSLHGGTPCEFHKIST